MSWAGCGSVTSMGTAASSSPLSAARDEQLVAACERGDLPSAKAAVALGACINGPDAGLTPSTFMVPLAAAVHSRHRDVAVWLLSQGANPNYDGVMPSGAHTSTPDILQLLIDAGGELTVGVGGTPPLFAALSFVREDNVRVLLAQPSLDLTYKYEGKTPEQYARETHWVPPALADVVAEEVR